MSKEFRMKLEGIFDVIGEILAFVALVIFVFYHLNSNFGWITNATALKVMAGCVAWSGFLLIAVVGAECTIKRNLVIRIIFYVLVAAGVIILFFPDTYNGLVGKVGGTTATLISLL